MKPRKNGYKSSAANLQHLSGKKNDLKLTHFMMTKDNCGKIFLANRRFFSMWTLMANSLRKVNPAVLDALGRLGYLNVEVKYGRVYARRGRDHLIIRLSKRGNPDFRLRAHQDIPSKTLLSHHQADYSSEKRLVKEFRRAFRETLKTQDQHDNDLVRT
jgi:hypothetical protein